VRGCGQAPTSLPPCRPPAAAGVTTYARSPDFSPLQAEADCLGGAAGSDLDEEGRVVVTDHGAFVLLNVWVARWPAPLPRACLPRDPQEASWSSGARCASWPLAPRDGQPLAQLRSGAARPEAPPGSRDAPRPACLAGTCPMRATTPSARACLTRCASCARCGIGRPASWRRAGRWAGWAGLERWLAAGGPSFFLFGGWGVGWGGGEEGRLTSLQLFRRLAPPPSAPLDASTLPGNPTSPWHASTLCPAPRR
jgi:hypothetical protein